MTTPVIAFNNRKGGVGKTTMSVTTAVGLSAKGYRIGVIDSDSQGNAGLMLGLPEADGLFNVLIERQPLEKWVMDAGSQIPEAADGKPLGALYVLPSAARTYKIPYELPQEEIFAFLGLTQQFADEYKLDAVILDTAPTMSMFDGAIYLAADAYVYVTECERMSLDGLLVAEEQMRRMIQKRETYLQRSSQIVGIIPNKARNTLVHRRNIEALQKHFGELCWEPIPLGTMWTEASNAEQTVFTYGAAQREAVIAWSIVEKVEAACLIANRL